VQHITGNYQFASFDVDLEWTYN